MSARLAEKVLLIVWRGADWEVANPFLDRGELPHMESLVNAGAMGNGVVVSNLYSHATAPLDEPWPVPPGTIPPERLEESLAPPNGPSTGLEACRTGSRVPKSERRPRQTSPDRSS